MKTLLYISTEMLAELKRNYNKIKGLFDEDLQAIFDEFLLELEKNGVCSTEECNNIYSILNNIHTDRISKKEKASIQKKVCDEDEKTMMDNLETLRMQFAMKYYFGAVEKKEVFRNNQYRNEEIK